MISDNYISPRRQLRFPTSPGSVFMVILQTEGGLPWRLSRIDRFGKECPSARLSALFVTLARGIDRGLHGPNPSILRADSSAASVKREIRFEGSSASIRIQCEGGGNGDDVRSVMSEDSRKEDASGKMILLVQHLPRGHRVEQGRATATCRRSDPRRSGAARRPKVVWGLPSCRLCCRVRAEILYPRPFGQDRDTLQGQKLPEIIGRLLDA